ncbi:MAG: hypothetical protein JNK82_30210, partial [Myxococcaceae bacterium]|nr:hypothetical protein [Myxococcaceae bacterium]
MRTSLLAMLTVRHELELSPLRPPVTVELSVPDAPRGVVIIADDGSAALRPRNLGLAWCLHQASFATVAACEGLGAWCRSPLLHGRLLIAATRWALGTPQCRGLKLGLLGLGRGSVAALVAAALAPATVKAVVAFDTQPAQAKGPTARVGAPTLLMTVRDDDVARRAAAQVFERLPRGSALSLLDGVEQVRDPMALLVDIARPTTRWFERALCPA